MNNKDYIGKIVDVNIDREFGSRHPKHGFIYPVNYGYIPNTISGDGEELDAYVLGVQEPLDVFYKKAPSHDFLTQPLLDYYNRNKARLAYKNLQNTTKLSYYSSKSNQHLGQYLLSNTHSLPPLYQDLIYFVVTLPQCLHSTTE